MPWSLRTAGALAGRSSSQEKRNQRSEHAELYHSAAWLKFRKHVLAKQPYCVDPFGRHAANGKPEPATEVDHIVEVGTWKGSAFDPANAQGLCKSCHSTKTGREHGIR